MVKVIGVRFRNTGKIYYFDPAKFDIQTGDHVIVETARGIEYGYVVLGSREVEDSKVVSPLKAVIRLATPEDEATESGNKKKEKEAFTICIEKIKKHNLQMKLIDAEYTFDNNKVLFYFTADGRIDFRELVKDLASIFKTRIELRQVGVRDETKIVGGIGICGRPLCCHSYLSDFIPVSIKMAKEQNLSLNPTKISGVCGRLMCCLKNEEETYEELNSKLPNIGDFVTTDDGLKGEVSSVSVLRQQVKVIVLVGKDEKEIREYKVEQLKFKPKRRKEKMVIDDAEVKQLEALEKKDVEKKDGKPKRDGNQPERFEKRDGNQSERFEKRDGNQSERFEKRDGNQSGRFEKRDGSQSERFEKRDGNQSERFRKRDGNQSEKFQRRDGNQSERGGANRRSSEKRVQNHSE